MKIVEKKLYLGIICGILLGMIELGHAKSEENSLSKEEFQRWAGVPALAFNGESGLIYGALVYHYLPQKSKAIHPSNLRFLLVGTTKNQYQFKWNPNLYWKNYSLVGYVTGYIWPAKLYGFGNHSSPDFTEYRSHGFESKMVLHRYFHHLFAGVGNHWLNEKVRWSGNDALSQSISNTPGRLGGKSVGWLAKAGYDTRDNPNSPYAGQFLEGTWGIYSNKLLSDFSYQTQEVSWGYYFPLFEKGTLAIRHLWQSHTGTAPFRQWSTPDGTDVLRGIEKGRYRAPILWAFQSEIRRFSVFHKRLGGTVFVEFAQVQNRIKELELQEFKGSFGLGLRFAMNSERRSQVRMDISWVDGGVQYLLNTNEAF